MIVFTIGFTKKTAERFFTGLRDAGVKRLVDVRLNNTSQLAGFTKRDDLRYFAGAICGIEYVHVPVLAPTADILSAYKKHKGDWRIYEQQFLDLMRSRQVEDLVDQQILDRGCLLCSEEKPDRCHRRLVAEYFQDRWCGVELHHIL